jgi:Subtilase family
MSEPTSRNAILAFHSVPRSVEADHLNAILERTGLGRLLGQSERRTSGMVVLPVSADPGAALAPDPRAVAAVLSDALRGDLRFEPNTSYGVHTVADRPYQAELIGSERFVATGLKSGHGTLSWRPVGRDKMADPPPWPPSGSPPVVVVLDSGVKQHDWLPATTGPSFCIEPDPGPSFLLPVPDVALITGNFGAYWGHATFLAGLIRLAAPDARVMSVKLMSDTGTLDDVDLLPALQWLIDYVDAKHRVDVVLMAFGRPIEPGEDIPEEPDEDNPEEPGEDNRSQLVRLISELHKRGVTVVASAGNDHSHTKTIPACLPLVRSVGAGSSNDDHEPYSNHGTWVTDWRDGDVVSLMPVTEENDKDTEVQGNGYARWSGTSFSAATLAGELAQENAGKRKASGGS